MSQPGTGKRKKGAKPLEFRLQMPDAKTVAVAGSFNNWDPGRGLMNRDNNGEWRLTVSLPPGRYEYRFVVDGQWTDDPNAKDFVPNVHGSANAVVVV
jgi:1,4-alpha-glucan branching enzyme